MPTEFKKVIVHQLSNDYDNATKIVSCPFTDLLNNLKPNQVIVKYYYAGINASDINFTAGRYDPALVPPFDCGFEAIGEVIAVGSKTTTKLLQPVAVMTYGAFSEYQIISEKSLIPVPSIDPRFLTLIVSGMTSYFALKYHGHMKSNETVLVTAAAGAAGQIAVQLAKQAGNIVIGTCSTGKEGFLKSLGVDRVINYKTEDVQKVLKTEFPNGVDIVFESVGGKMFEMCMKALAVKGRLIIIGAISSYATKVQDESKMNTFHWDTVKTNTLLAKSNTLTGFFLNHYSKEFPQAMQYLTTSVTNGTLKPVIHSQMFQGLSSISDAIKCLHSGKNIGKVVVEIQQRSKL